MTAEIKALEHNQTWVLTSLPPGKRTVGCKWVYKTKFKANGDIERHKARLVAKGYTQTEGLDYFDTFSPVAKMTSLRVLLSIAAAKNWHLHQLDVNNAFLHGDLNEEVYMELPQGFLSSQPNLVCKLQKSLYGLKQASRQWYSKLSTTLLSYGYRHSTSDHSLFFKASVSSFTAILVYVDDVIITGNDMTEINTVKQQLDAKFSIKDLGELRYFLGLELARSKDGIFLCQRKFALELLEDSGYLACKPASSPMDPSLKLSKDKGTSIPDPTSYRQLIGRLQYLTTTRPDISFVTQQLSQFLADPKDIHLQAAHRVLRYIKSSPGAGIFLSADSDLKLRCFTDSDWASCIDSRRSVTGWVVFLGRSLISWKAKKQATTSRSSSEAEYRALASSTCEVQWLIYLLNDFDVSHLDPALIYCDNQSAIQIANNPTFHERTKHIEIDCHIVREKVQSRVIHLLPVRSADQLADVFTKALHPTRFHTLISKLGMRNIHAPACGGCQI